MGLGAFALISDYEQERDGAVTYAGHGVYTYDPKVDRYSLHWFDSMGSPPELFVGTFEGDVLALAHGGTGGGTDSASWMISSQVGLEAFTWWSTASTSSATIRRRARDARGADDPDPTNPTRSFPLRSSDDFPTLQTLPC